MKIVILGKGKSGTTVLLHMVAAAFPECRPVLGGFRAHAKLRARPDSDPNASFACKFTYNDKKGRSFDAVMRHIAEEGYDKKIWVTRDPRDNAVSDALFRWRGRHGKSDRQFRKCLPLVRRKEGAPLSVPFHEIYRYSGDPGGPDSLQRLIEMEKTRYERMCEFVRGLDDDWFIFKYEDLVDGNFGAFSTYLGREIVGAPEVRDEDRVKARTKSYGDWRNWFLEEDIRIFAPIYGPYMELVGYDATDWKLDADPSIEPAMASKYMERLSQDGRPQGLQALKARVSRLYESTAAFINRQAG